MTTLRYSNSNHVLERKYGREYRNKPVWLKKYGPPTRTDNKLIVENLSSGVSWQDLKDFMRKVTIPISRNYVTDPPSEGEGQ